MESRSTDSYQSFTTHLADREYFGQKLGLERIQALLGRLGNPERKFKSIHIAGTNGKGSTAAMIASILKSAGYQVGLYTSPHLVDFCERVQGKGSFISPGQVLHYARMIRAVEQEPLTFFELATAIGFLHFAEEKVDLAVIETGLGGRLDATNVITPLVSVITTIGMDHTQYLGDTIEQIATEKAGIIKEGLPVVVGELMPEAMKVVREVAFGRGSPFINPPSPPFDKGGKERIFVSLAGAHQRQNAAVAVDVVRELQKQRHEIPESSVQRGLENVCWPGRLETVQERPWILLDGAHNPQAMAAVRQFLKEKLEGRRLKVLFGAMVDKDLPGILAEIAPITDQFIFTALPMKRAADPQRLSQIASTLGKDSVLIEDAAKAWESAVAGLKENEILLATGSFYLVGEIKRILGLLPIEWVNSKSW